MRYALALTLVYATSDVLHAQGGGAGPAAGPNEACLACHGNADAKAADGRSIAVDAAKFASSVHASMQLPCVACHADVAADKFPHGVVKPVQCATCHDKAVSEYAASVHVSARPGGSKAAATCTSCHGSHDILRAADGASRTNRANLDKTCGVCHADFASTYRDTFHGQVTQLGFTQIATCASCHGAHEVLPRDNPWSKVSAQNRLATCQACHPKANANFASYDPHANKRSRERGQVLFYTGRFMDLLLLGVFLFFGAHTLLWFLRSLRAMREKKRSAAPAAGEKR